MTVTKILEQTLSAGSTTVSFTDSDIPNSLIRVYSSNSDLIPVSRTLTNNTLTVTYEPQLNDVGVAVEIVKAGLDIVDNLTSTDSDKALSAKQGKELKDAIDEIPTSYTASDIDITPITGIISDNVQGALSEVFTSVSSGKELIADAITDKGVITSADDTFLEMAENIANIPSGGGGSGEAVIKYYSGWQNTQQEISTTYTATASGTLFIGAFNVINSYMANGYDIPKAYINNVEVTPTASGGGTWYWQYNNASKYAFYEIPVTPGDVIKIVGISYSSNGTYQKIVFVSGVLV